MPPPSRGWASTPPTPWSWRRRPSACCASSSSRATASTASSRRAVRRANIIPAHASADYMVRAATRDAHGGAPGARARLLRGRRPGDRRQRSRSPSRLAYSDMRHDHELATLYRSHAESLGRVFAEEPSTPVSTDMGNVSYVVPSIHPFIGIEAARRGQPPGRVRGRLRRAVGRPGHLRRCPGHGPDGHRRGRRRTLRSGSRGSTEACRRPGRGG